MQFDLLVLILKNQFFSFFLVPVNENQKVISGMCLASEGARNGGRLSAASAPPGICAAALRRAGSCLLIGSGECMQRSEDMNLIKGRKRPATHPIDCNLFGKNKCMPPG
jgi:hypothetical protein